MLFGYPQAGFQDNWVHEALLQMLEADLHSIDVGNPPVDWPGCIPPVHRQKLQTRIGLRDRRTNLLDAYQGLTGVQRQRVRAAMLRQNEIPAIFADDLPCDRLQGLPDAFLEGLQSFFEFAFSILSDLGLRDQNYCNLYHDEHFRDKVCAFCGLEILDAPGQKRESLDHYLLISRYPFAAVNFRNLVPMGTKCNSRYKGQQDIIVDAATGNRRVCCDPFTSPAIKLSLLNSQPFEGDTIDFTTCPQWSIEWVGGDPIKLQTWESVFGISERYRESSLNPNFRSWMDHFGQWATRTNQNIGTTGEVKQTLLNYCETVLTERYSDSAFLKRAALQMLAHHCDDSEDGKRLVAWLIDIVTG